MASIFQLFPNSRPDSINRKIFRAAVIVGVLGILARIAGTGKELVVAHAFGRSDALDAFLIAYLMPAFAVNLLMGALGSALLPVLVETRQKQGAHAAEEFLSSTVCLSAVVLLIVAALLGLCAPLYLPLLGHGFPAAKLLLTRKLLYLLLPWVVFSGIATLLSYIMNAGEKFAAPAIVPLATTSAVILCIVLARWGGIFSLVIGTVIGGLLEAVVLLRFLATHEIHLRFRWSGFDPRVRKMLAQYAPMLAGSFLMGGTAVVDQAIAAMLPGGSVAALNYANKISGAIAVIGTTALSTAAFPYFSKMVAENDWHGCRHTLKRYVVLITAIAVPLTLLLIVFSKPIIRVLFQRGAFTSSDTELVSLVQACYCLQLPFYFLGSLLARFISSMRRNDLLMYASALNLGVNIVMDLVLMKVWGIAGIAVSTAIVYFVSVLFLSVSSIKLLRDHVPEVVTTVQAHASQ